MNTGIIWLASYPKSGNTWMRIFLENYLLDGDEPANINRIKNSQISSNRVLFDRITGLKSSDMTQAEIDSYRPELYEFIAQQNDSFFPINPHKIFKAHDAYTCLEDGRFLFPAQATRAVIYIIRNPLDVLVSLTAHFGFTVDQTIEFLTHDNASLANFADRITPQFGQQLGSWATHVNSWNTAANIPRLLVRYEDMLSQPQFVFGQVTQFLFNEYDSKRLEKAIRFSSFKTVKKQEQQDGFAERPLGHSSMFFRRGQAGGWQEELSVIQAREVIDTFSEAIAAYGYEYLLDELI